MQRAYEPSSGQVRDEELWKQLKPHLGVTDGRWPGWDVLGQAAYELGFHEYARAWGYTPPPKAPFRYPGSDTE